MRKPCSRIPCSSPVCPALNLGFYTLVNLAPGHDYDREDDDHDDGEVMMIRMIRILLMLCVVTLQQRCWIMVDTDRRTLMCWRTPLKT